MVDIILKHSPIEITSNQAEKMSEVCKLLLKKNEAVNLTAIKTEYDAAILHFVDSLYPLTTGKVKGSVLDVGSGGGFPAFPIAICSDLQVTALDATQKKLQFICETAAECKIENIKTLYGRAEELSHLPEYREKYDTVVSRAVAKMNVLCEWCIPYVKMGGYFIAMKGSKGTEEVEQAKKAIRFLGGKLVDIIDYNLPNDDRV
ncbi:MAG: 16S rRNA (guanine(527)-N(7))-methyltransferase RsmG, partial [Clostridia bacterium]